MPALQRANQVQRTHSEASLRAQVENPVRKTAEEVHTVQTTDAETSLDAAAHPMPVTVALLRDALGKLRAVEANQGSTGGGDDEGAFASPRVSPRELHLYRGMKDVRAPLEFLAQGGTELAPMSTTSSLAVAMKYSASRNAVLLRLVTDSFISRGPDISFLSAFPAEREFLFPPLTYLAPTGNVEKISVGGASWDVVDVKPHL